MDCDLSGTLCPDVGKAVPRVTHGASAYGWGWAPVLVF